MSQTVFSQNWLRDAIIRELSNGIAQLVPVLSVPSASHSQHICHLDLLTGNICLTSLRRLLWMLSMRFVAERGGRAQLSHIENIHRAYELKPVPQLVATPLQNRISRLPLDRPLPVLSTIPR